MQLKWKMFIQTFFTYATIHSARTAWSSLKYLVSNDPYDFSPLFLGAMDMIVLFALALSLNLLGPSI